MKIEYGGCRSRLLRSALVAVLCLSVGFPAIAGSAKLRREGRELFWGEKRIQLVGYSYYGLVGDRWFDAEAFLETLAAHNINLTRFFLILPWPVEPPRPNLLPFARTGRKYDLRRFDEQFFVRLRSVVKTAERLGIVCQVCLFDRCGLAIADRRAWPNNPYNADCNVNGMLKGGKGGYPLFCQVEGPIAEINAAFIRKVVETIGDCPNVIYEIINEPYEQLGPLPQWHVWVARQLRKNLAGRAGSKVISAGERRSYNAAEEIDVFAMHSASDARRVAAAVRLSEDLDKPLILSDDGDRRSMFNPDVTAASAKRALALGKHFEHLEFTITLQREEQRRRAARLDEMPALCQLNLRSLARCSTPLLSRPYVRRGGVRKVDGRYLLWARIERAGEVGRVFGEWSGDGGKSWSRMSLSISNGIVESDALPARAGARNLVRVVCIDGQSRRWPGPVYHYGPQDEWTVRLGEQVVEAGLMRVRPYIPDGAIRAARRGGRSCYETDPDRRGKYAYFRLEDSFPRGAVRGPVTVAVEYFDEPAGSKLRLEYDGEEGPYSAAQPVVLAGSGKWKRASFRIDDAIFRGRQNDGADLRFSLQEPVAPLALRWVGVRYSKAAK